jgi:putative phosphoribosyl transferase
VPYRDRIDAGRQLAARLDHLDGDVVVVGLPRGGVPVAAEVARAFDAPLDVIVVRKVGVPFQPELAMGAVGEGGVSVVDEDVVRLARVSAAEFRAVEARERDEVVRRAERFRAGRQGTPLAGRVVVIVDDGIATGSTARAACTVARAAGARKIVLAVPVAPPDWTDRLGDVADELVAVDTPEPFYGVGQFYVDFSPTTDDEVVACLTDEVSPSAIRGGATAERLVCDDDVVVHAGSAMLHGRLTVPDHASAVVVFAHGSGSSRHSPRNRYVAGVLNSAGLATLLVDLLTPTEEVDRRNVFDVGFLAERLRDVTHWVRGQPETAATPVCYFGASTGAAAALAAAAEEGGSIAAVVSRGGRPDLAGPLLGHVVAPTLLIVGGDDPVVLALNREALTHLRCEHRMAVVPGATHLFEEPGALQTVAHWAMQWFLDHIELVGGPAAGAPG